MEKSQKNARIIVKEIIKVIVEFVTSSQELLNQKLPVILNPKNFTARAQEKKIRKLKMG